MAQIYGKTVKKIYPQIDDAKTYFNQLKGWKMKISGSENITIHRTSIVNEHLAELLLKTLQHTAIIVLPAICK